MESSFAQSSRAVGATDENHKKKKGQDIKNKYHKYYRQNSSGTQHLKKTSPADFSLTFIKLEQQTESGVNILILDYLFPRILDRKHLGGNGT